MKDMGAAIQATQPWRAWRNEKLRSSVASAVSELPHELRVLYREKPHKLTNHEGHEDHQEVQSSVSVSEAMSGFPSSASW